MFIANHLDLEPSLVVVVVVVVRVVVVGGFAWGIVRLLHLDSSSLDARPAAEPPEATLCDFFPSSVSTAPSLGRVAASSGTRRKLPLTVAF